MDRQEAITRLKQESYHAEPEQDFEVSRLRPEDGWAVARCFFEVYGEDYPFDTYYIPERLIEENEKGELISVVARTPKGDVIGYGALFRNSAYNPGIYEFGQATVVPQYRSTLAFMCIVEFIVNTIASDANVAGVFGESVCNHLLTQRFSSIQGLIETGIEVGLMPSETYKDKDFPDDRVSCVLSFYPRQKNPSTLYIPPVYEEQMRFMISGFDMVAHITLSDNGITQSNKTNIITKIFEKVGVCRFSIVSAGSDIDEVVASAEAQARETGCVVYQAFVNLGEPWCGEVVSLLRRLGYFIGAYLPGWFHSDGLLMQKLMQIPNLNSIRLYSERSKELLHIITQDIEKQQPCLKDRAVINTIP